MQNSWDGGGQNRLNGKKLHNGLQIQQICYYNIVTNICNNAQTSHLSIHYAFFHEHLPQ